MRIPYARLESMTETEIARLARQLPKEVRQALRDVPVHLHARPDADIAKDFGEDLLGLFSGEARQDRGETLLPEPPQIHLYLENIWAFADHEIDAYMEEVRVTLLHELGHYLGWDEDDMERYGIA
ncbi:MAG TPA: metallopeptidase family protein [Opitutales bacterium]|nr:metallopeptidase family protein [Opitutales bacterium]